MGFFPLVCCVVVVMPITDGLTVRGVCCCGSLDRDNRVLKNWHISSAVLTERLRGQRV